MTSSDDLSTALSNQACGSVLAETLARLCLRHVVHSPGSRSTPIVLACADHPRLELLPLLDERSAGFFALGLAKRSQAPVALVCTSGTAAANLYPAVIEANLSQAPLLLLTADRPPELRECRAGQAIDQTKLYGSQVRHFHELGLPEFTSAHLAYLRQTLVHAVNLATGRNPGAVHLNLPFREPFFSDEDGPNPPLPEGFDSEVFFQQIRPPVPTRLTPEEDPADLLACYSRLLITAGEDVPPEDAVRLAEGLSAPLLADPCSPLRETPCPQRILRYEHLLRDDSFRSSHHPDAVISLGPLPACKTLRAWLEETEAPTFLLHPGAQNPDPLHRRALPLSCDAAHLADSLPFGNPDLEWLDSWTEAESKVEARLDDAFAKLDEPFEGNVARILSEALPDACDLFVANSMPIRDVEWFWKPGASGRRLHANRGANGIDGTLSTAMGIAHASDSPAYLLTGDLAFLHDTNGLLATETLAGNLTVILLNNKGGGIFENLPVAKLPAFEKHFATSQKTDIAQIAQAHGACHKLVPKPSDLPPLLQDPPKQGVQILEVRTNRKADVAIRRGLLNSAPV